VQIEHPASSATQSATLMLVRRAREARGVQPLEIWQSPSLGNRSLINRRERVACAAPAAKVAKNADLTAIRLGPPDATDAQGPPVVSSGRSHPAK